MTTEHDFDAGEMKGDGPLEAVSRRLRSARAWGVIKEGISDKLPLPRKLLMARLAVVCAIVLFGFICVVIVWGLGPLRQEAMRRADEEVQLIEQHARLTQAALLDEQEDIDIELAQLRRDLASVAANRSGEEFDTRPVDAVLAALRKDVAADPLEVPLSLVIAELDALIVGLRVEESKIANVLDSQFDLLTLLVVGALVLSAITLLLMERTNRAKERLAALHYRATHDHLTQGLNRGAILHLAERELARADRLERGLALFLVDLDEFKQINDRFGHVAGDVVIREAAQRLHRNLRLYDSVGRYGGDEFLLVLPDADAEEAKLVARRLCEAFRIPMDLGDIKKRVSISLGIAIHRGEDEDLDELISRADRALYRAKEAGRDTWAVDGPEESPATEVEQFVIEEESAS